MSVARWWLAVEEAPRGGIAGAMVPPMPDRNYRSAGRLCPVRVDVTGCSWVLLAGSLESRRRKREVVTVRG